MALEWVVRALKLDRFEPDRIVTSNLVRPLYLAILRGLFCLYSIIVVLSKWITADNAVEYLQYFTNLAYCGLVLYLLVGFLHVPSADR